LFLTKAQAKVNDRTLNRTGLWQFFSTDPNGALVELDFSSDEAL